MRAHALLLVPFVLGAAAASGCASHEPSSPVPTPSEASTTDAPPPVASTGRAAMTLPTSTASAPPPEPAASFEVWTTCSSDPDCVLSDVDPESCCETCTQRAMTRAQQEEQAAQCNRAPDRPCPDMDCKPPRNAARCQDHQCVVAKIRLPTS